MNKLILLIMVVSVLATGCASDPAVNETQVYPTYQSAYDAHYEETYNELRAELLDAYCIGEDWDSDAVFDKAEKDYPLPYNTVTTRAQQGANDGIEAAIYEAFWTFHDETLSSSRRYHLC